MAPNDGISGGTVYVDVVPDAEKFASRLGRQVEPQAAKVGQEIGRQLAKQIADGIRGGLDGGFRGSPGRDPGRKTGDQFAGEFDRTVRTKISAALRSIPPAKIGAEATPAEQKIKDLRVQLERLSGKQIGVDVDAGEALAEVEQIRTDLARLGAQSPDVRVRVDTARAAESLAAIQSEINRVDGRTANARIDVDAGGATAQLAAFQIGADVGRGALGALIGVGASLGPALIPAIAAVVAGIGAIGPVALASAAGLGVLVLAGSGVIGAVKAMQQAEDASSKTAATSASRNLALAGATDQVRQAKAALANTTANAAVQQQRAAQQVEDAERDLASALADEVRVQQTLNAAREDARRALEDLNDQVIDNGLAQQRAAYALTDAETALNDVRADPTASQRQRDEAKLAYDEASQRAAELQRQQQRLEADRAAAQRAGIDGSQQVTAAQDRIAEAAARVDAAERRVTETRQQQAEQARQAEYAISQAQQAVVAAARSVQSATISAGTAGGAAVEALRQSLEGLSPAGRGFAEFLFGLKPALLDLRQAAETAVLPGLQAGMQALLPVLPSVRDAITAVGGALGEFFRQAGVALASPFWQDFFRQMAQLTVTVIQLAGPILGNLAQGVAGILIAFAPLAPVLGQALVELTRRYADFATGLASNPEFQEFISYAIANAPTLVALLGNLAVVAIKLLIAFAPLGGMLLALTARIVGWLASLDPGMLSYITAAVLAIAGGIATAAGGVVAGVALMVGAVVGLVGFVIYAYQHWDTFRAVVDGAVAGIVAAVQFAYTAIQPVIDAIGALITNVLAPAVLWMWHNVWEPAWQGIQFAVEIVRTILEVQFGLIQIAFKILGALLSGVWSTTIKPIFDFFGAILAVTVVPAFKAGVDAIGAAWERIRDVAKVPVRFVVDTILNGGLLAGYNKLASLFGVKPDNVRIDLPQGFATGGLIRGPGTGTSDSILAQVAGGPAIRVSNGEYIVPAAAVRAFGVDFFDMLAGKGPANKRPGDGSQGLAFALGGLIDFGKDLWKAVTHPVDTLAKPINALIDRIPGGPWMRDIVGGVAHRLVDGLVDWARNAGGKGSNVNKTRAFLAGQEGKPYVWAAAGPDGYDCSGLVSAAWNVWHGKSPYSHTFSTSNEASFFPVSGHGLFTAGWAGPGEQGGGSVGHTAGLLAGLGFEATGSGGVRIGNGTTNVDSFAHVGTFDTGGWLPQGLTLAYNGTRSPELVLTGDQVADLKRGAGPSRTINVYPQRADFTVTELQALEDRQDAIERVGRVS